MENNLFSDARYAVMCSMLFMMIVAVTAERRRSTRVFSKIWRQYMIFQERERPGHQGRQRKSSGRST